MKRKPKLSWHKKVILLTTSIALVLSGCGTIGTTENTDENTGRDVTAESTAASVSEAEETTGLYASDLIDLDELIGWASVSGDGVETTTGGGDVTPVLVTTYEELVSLAADDEPRVILVQGTITCSEGISVGCNKTIVGLDEEAVIQGGLDITGVSWCKFDYTNTRDHRLACLIGSGDEHEDTDQGKLNVTLHHNWFGYKIIERMPRIRFGKVHIYNNYYTSASSARGYCIGVSCYASALIENNYFQDVTNPHQFIKGNEFPAYITASGNIYDNTSGSQLTGISTQNLGEVEPFTEPPYEYAADDAEDVPEIVTEGAGPRNLPEL